jgi:hypothetical protein
MSIINIEVSRDGKTVVAPFLIDTGAQSSYISDDYVAAMGIDTQTCQTRYVTTINNTAADRGVAGQDCCYSCVMNLELYNLSNCSIAAALYYNDDDIIVFTSDCTLFALMIV